MCWHLGKTRDVLTCRCRRVQLQSTAFRKLLRPMCSVVDGNVQFVVASERKVRKMVVLEETVVWDRDRQDRDLRTREKRVKEREKEKGKGRKGRKREREREKERKRKRERERERKREKESDRVAAKCPSVNAVGEQN